MDEDDINTYGISIIFKIVILVIFTLSTPIAIYVLIWSIFEMDTIGEQKYLIIVSILFLLLCVYCILVLKYKIIYFDKTIIFKFVILNKIIDLGKYKYFKIDYKTIPISYILFTENKEKKVRIHYFYTKMELFYRYLIKNLEKI